MSNLVLVEGISGAGKSTAINFIQSYLSTFNIQSHTFNEPGHMRDEIKKYHNREDRDLQLEFDHYVLSRKVDLHHKVMPTIKNHPKDTILIDRSWISTMVYQQTEQCPMINIRDYHSFYPKHNLALLLICDPETAYQRILKRKETQGIELSTSENPKRIAELRKSYIEAFDLVDYSVIINTDGSENAVNCILKSYMNKLLGIKEKKIFFLDKDGTLVDNSKYPEVIPTDEILFADTLEGLYKLKSAGYEFHMISSQPWVAKGQLSLDQTNEIFESVIEQYKKYGIEFTGYGFCEHHRSDNCPDKKPNTGLLEQIATQQNIDISQSFFIGDMESDIECGYNFGLQTGLVTKYSNAKTIDNLSQQRFKRTPNYTAINLNEIANQIIEN